MRRDIAVLSTRRITRVAALASMALGVSLLAIAPHEAVAASATTATLVIQKGGDRAGAQAVDGLASASFDFIAGTANTVPPANAPVAASCVTGANGKCSVNVAGRDTGNQGYWIRETTAPAGFSIAQTLDTGTSSVTNPTIYNPLFTGNVANNTTRTFPEAGTGGSLTSRGNFWADIRDNPGLPGECGLNIALLIDTSGSIGGDIGNVKTAAKGFVDVLTGTPSQIALYSFSTNASARLASTPVSDTNGANAVKTAINNLPNPNGSTNWDQGLFQIAAAPMHYDAVIMLTDGNPTVYGPPPETGPGSNTRFREVENGIFSANALKAKGTKIVAVGVGNGVTGAKENLQAISGTVEGTDYVQTGYPRLAKVFRDLALSTCKGTISVVKKVIPPGRGLADATPAGGWTFATSTSGVTPASGVTADNTGALNFQVDIPVGSDTKSVTINEAQQAGYALVPGPLGTNATCTSTGTSVPASDSGPTGFTVGADRNNIVTCIVYNRAPKPPARVVVDKTWIINGTSYDNPTQPADFEAALALTGRVDPQFGTTYTGYEAGDKVTVGEVVDTDAMPPGCTNVPSGDIGGRRLAAGLNEYQITNTVTCAQTLTLRKYVINPYGTPEPATSWTLSALPPGGGTPVVTGTNGVKGDVDSSTKYPLTETDVPGYKQEIVSGSTIPKTSTGSWHCVLRMRDGSTGPEFDGLNGTVTVQLGQNAECTANNIAQPAQLTLKKNVLNTHGGTAANTDWILHADPQSPNPDAKPIMGRDGQPSVTDATAFPNTPYTLNESDGPLHYLPVGDPTCVLTGSDAPVPAPGGVLTPTIGQDITCTFVNQDEDVPPPTPTPTPTTTPLPPTGSNFGPMSATGVMIFLVGLALLVASRRWRATRDAVAEA